MRRPYRGIYHPAVSKVACAYCHEARGVPCRAVRSWGDVLPPDYTQTHAVRIRQAEVVGGLKRWTARLPKPEGGDAGRF